MGSYLPLFSVSVMHLYFSDGLWKGLKFVPDFRTAKMIDGAGILIRQTKNGIGVFYDVGKSTALRLYAEDAHGVLCFSFKVYAKDRTFENYTLPSSQKENAVLCFDNQASSGDEEFGTIKLSKDSFASVKDFQEIKTLVEGGILCERDRRMPPDFVVNIFIEPGKSDGSIAPDYGIKFNARQSFWKYHLLGNMNKSNLFIVDLDNRVEFEFCGEVVLPGSRPAKVFRSKELIPVMEKSSYRFQLREPGPGAGKVLIKRLPVASESRLGMEVINGRNEVVSESYINY